jgi:predicted dehydrogenase
MGKTGLGIYGSNGHQIHPDMLEGLNAYIAGVCEYTYGDVDPSVPVYDSFEELLKCEDVQLVTICSGIRRNQGDEIISALKAHKHVFAEKPSTMDIGQLDAILQLAEENHVIFCEMAGVMYDRPYNKAKEIIESGVLGQIVQVFVQKSYPYHDRRPQDERFDGGLIEQCALYGMRFIEHIAGQRIASIDAIETSLGNPVTGGGLKMAAAINMRLESGGIAAVIANYLNQPSTKIWGNEELRVFGTDGFLRTNPFNNTVEVFTKDQAIVYETESEPSLFAHLVDCISNGKPLPYSSYELTHPTRLAILAKHTALAKGF